MNKTVEELKQIFQANFLDGDELPAKATTFSAIGAFDVAEFFYNLAITSQRQTLREEIGKMRGTVFGEDVVARADVLALITNDE